MSESISGGALSKHLSGGFRRWARFSIKFFWDLLISLTILIGLMLFAWFLKFAKISGLIQDRYLAVLENVHFLGSLATMACFVIHFVFELFRELFFAKEHQ